MFQRYLLYNRNMDNKTFRRWATKVEPQANGCWLWTGAVAGQYGSLWNTVGNSAAHILAYDHFRGPYIKIRYYVLDHMCEK